MNKAMLLGDPVDFSLLQTVEAFAKSRVREKANELDHTETFPSENVEALAKMGALGIPFPSTFGGQNGSMSDYVDAIRLLAKECGATSSIVLTHTSFGAWPIQQFGTDNQKEKYLRPLLSGQALGALAMSEEFAGSEGVGIQTYAEDMGNHWELNGHKRYVSNAGYADIYIVVATTDQGKGTEGLSMFLLEKGMEGLNVGTFEQKMGLRALPVAELILDKVRVPKENLLGTLNQGFRQMECTQDIIRLSIAAQAVGLGEGALERALAYVGKKRQFGGRLIDLQNTQFKLAEMTAAIAASKALLEQAAVKKDHNRSIRQEAAMAKLVAARTAVDTTETAIQVTGGFGYMRTHEIERYSRDAKLTELYGGTSETQKMIIASPWVHQEEEVGGLSY